ncbi:MAG: ABC transporter permease, partial [Lachnospiraceae bacterium]|nr:ABC transporter permease [Lachnospiraceae bacterium]
FGVKDSVTDVAGMQYDEIQMYDIGISFSDAVDEAEANALTEQTGDKLSEIAFLYEESVDMDFGGRTKSVYLDIPESIEEIAAFLSLHTKDGEEIPYPGKGEAVLTAKIAENMGIQVGDKVTLRDTDMNQLTVTVTALCENYVYNYIYIHQDTYEEQLGIEPEYKNAYARIRENVDAHETAAAISDRNNVLSVTVIQDMRERFVSMMESMDYIVALIIICAGSLAFIVLYNLTNINITERIREIATIKVLGFYAKETADYVFRENMILTGMGALAGLLLGKWLHWFVMYHVNIDMVSFKTLITPFSYVLSLLFTFGFAVFVNIIMFFKLEKINMAESLKSIE